MVRGPPRNEAVPSTSTYWEGPSSTGSAATYFPYLEDTVALYTEHHIDDESEAGSYADTTATNVHHNFYEDVDTYEQDHEDRSYATGRLLETKEEFCETKCGDNRPTVEAETDFYALIRGCINADAAACPLEFQGFIDCWDVSEVINVI
mmetsp:Transcript_31819/g.32291  ORF Transcript_31819/g.32291 Transcript_31819/m.32291 type:complete len:149 (-) Transcript_31819:65-511(-)